MAEKFSPRSLKSSGDERFEAKRTISFATCVNGVDVEFAVTVPWRGDFEIDEGFASEATAAVAERAPPSA